MSHLGVLSYESTGHLNPMIALSRQLADRGHRVTFFQRPEVAAQIRPHGLEFVPIGPHKIADGTSAIGNHALPTINTLRSRVRWIISDMNVFLRDGPPALASAGVDALIVDEIALTGPTLAEMLGLPYFVVSTSVPHVLGWSAPRRIMPKRTFFERLENALLHVSVLHMKGPLRRNLDKARRQAGLGPIRQIEKVFPPRAYIAQLPECVDYPELPLPRNFHYAGPFLLKGTRKPIEFPWHGLDSRPLVYASLGTTRKSDPANFRMIAEACHGLDLQLVISLGGRRDPGMLADLPGKPVVVREAPQLEMVRLAEIVITHGGLNTALEALMEGKPMLVLPKSFDQPAVAARLERLGVAEVLRVDRLSAKRIRGALIKLRNNSSYRQAARGLQENILAGRALERAANIIDEHLAKTTRPTYA